MYKKHQAQPATPTHSESGFTLLEMVIVVLITSVLMGAIFRVMGQDGEIKNSRMNSIFDTALLGIAEYTRIYGFYPCPADPALRPGDANYGEPNLNAAGQCSPAAAGTATPGFGGGTVIIGSIPVRALNRAIGCSETDEALLPDNLKQVFQNKLNSVGQIFFGDGANYENYSDFDQDGTAANNTLNITDTSRKCVVDSLGHDIYGAKLTYAVTYGATFLTNAEPAGNIRIVNRNGSEITADPVHFVLISHGPDTKGAHLDMSGIIGSNCGTGASLDDENCDNDSTFRAMPFSGIASMYENNHYDDRVEFSLTGYLREKDVWRWAEGASTDERNVVLNSNTAPALNIGIPGTATVDSDAKLSVYGGNMEVEGDLRAEGVTGSGGTLSKIRANTSMTAGDNIVVDDGTGSGSATAPKFCYDPPMTSSCQ